MAASLIECAACGGAGGLCETCGTPDCSRSCPGGSWIACAECNGEGGREAPEHADAPVPLPQLQPVDPAGDAERELVQLRGELARERRYITEQQHVAICTAAILERVQKSLDELRDQLQAADMLQLLGASAPFLAARAGIVTARAQAASGICVHTFKSDRTTTTTNRQPARVIELAARKQA
jgi:hypothetical protein